MKKLITPLLVFAALVGGFFAARTLDAQVIWSPRQGIHFTGTVDPTTGLGLVAAEGTIYVRTGATDGLYVKTGSGNTAWTAIALSGGAASFSTVSATTFLAGDGAVGTPSYSFTSDPNSGYWRAADGDTRMSSNGAERHKFDPVASTASGFFLMSGSAQVNGGNLIVSTGRNIEVRGGYIEMGEIAAPGAGAADKVRIYPVVDGGAKTDLAAIFQSGAAQVFTQEP